MEIQHDPTELAIILGTKEFWGRLAKDPARLAAEVCSINIVKLDETLQMHAALRAWVNATHEVARITEAKLKWEDTKARAQTLLAIKRIDPATNKSKTGIMMEAEVELDAKVQQTTANIFAQQEVRSALRAMADALEDRKDMLIQIAAKQRKEMQDYQ